MLAAFERVSHDYGERRALDALSLDIRGGEVLGLLGSLQGAGWAPGAPLPVA